MARRFLSAAAVFLLAACHSGGQAKPVPVLSKISAPGADAAVDYVASFRTAAEARAHADAVVANGGKVESLDRAGRIQRVTAAAAALGGVAVDADTLVNANTRVVRSRPAGSALRPDGADGGADAAQAFLTARQVTGVEALLQRFPTADGRGVKVAVLDEGIDFGLEGISKDGKLAGFYDFTGFGKLPLAALPSDTVQAEYTIGAAKVSFGPGLAPQKVQATGTLDEAALARDYLDGVGVDLNGNEKTGEAFPVLVGFNAEGKPAVWIDANLNGLIDSRDGEELTDFNTTGKYVLMAPGASPSGARPLAATIKSPTEVQFHSVPGGHGTSCAVIVAGDGYANGSLHGMAPKAQLLSYMLDVDGQDVYTLAQFVAMFVHAKEQGADAITSSWGFATADLASARFVGDFLDREIAGAGVVIGIAAGNEGPGIGSAAPDDYLPHNGFGVGALISTEQAKNVYGWTGTPGDGVVFYSSFGPTVGGRQVPDAISPIATFVRQNRSVAGPVFYAFSGTSSATPALVGSVSALISALKQNQKAPIDARLIKLAVQGTAHPLAGVEALRQGPGVLDVAAAYDLYLKLAAEQAAAAPGANKPFAYELRASTELEGQALPGEGVVLSSPRAAANVAVKMTEASAALVDPLTFVQPLLVKHAGDFFAAPSVVSLQATGAKLTVQFDQSKLAAPGTYNDVLEFARPADGLVLLRVPVVVQVPSAANALFGLANVNAALKPWDLWRQPFTLSAPSAVSFEGIAQDLGGNANSALGLMVQGRDGHRVFQGSAKLDGAVQSVKLTTGVLPAGTYEVILFRSFSQPAALGDIQVAGSFHLPAAAVAATQLGADALQVALKAQRGLKVTEAALVLDGAVRTTVLKRDLTAARPGYYGTIDLGADGDGATDLVLGLRQNALERSTERFLAAETTLIDRATGQPVYRGWIDVEDAGSPRRDAALTTPAHQVDVVSYPNFTNWDKVETSELTLEVGVPFAQPLVVTPATVSLALASGQVAKLSFTLPAGFVAAKAYGHIELKNGAAVIDSIPLELP